MISYPLYIWHWPLISYAYIIRLGKMPTPLMAAGLLVVAFLLAWTTYYLVERPIRFGTRRFRTQIAVAAVVVMCGCGLLVWRDDGFPGRFPSLPGIDMRKISEAARDPVFEPTKQMEVTSYDGTVLAHLGKGAQKVAFVGDSVLFQYGPRVQQLADENLLTSNIWFIVGGSCAPLPGVIQRDDFAHCANVPGLSVDLVRRENIQRVVLGASWAGYIGDAFLIERGGRRFSLASSEGTDAFYANLEDYVGLLRIAAPKSI